MTAPSDIDDSARGHRPDLFTGLKREILDLLLNNRSNWVPAFTLASVALHCSAKVKELRDVGYLIENQTTRHGPANTRQLSTRRVFRRDRCRESDGEAMTMERVVHPRLYGSAKLAAVPKQLTAESRAKVVTTPRAR